MLRNAPPFDAFAARAKPMHNMPFLTMRRAV